MAATLSGKERLSGKTAIAALMGRGRWSQTLHLRCCCLSDNGLDFNRIMVSVPKRHFKRAVKRNLLKRRMREAYRLNKDLCTPGGHDILFVYSSSEIVPFAVIRDELTSLLSRISAQ
ncbi:MAG: ribonuclease P protein component [Bacteroidales bacterium]|nr:ribonuclease P protein component [Bacteroidales bacterium]